MIGAYNFNRKMKKKSCILGCILEAILLASFLTIEKSVSLFKLLLSASRRRAAAGGEQALQSSQGRRRAAGQEEGPPQHRINLFTIFRDSPRDSLILLPTTKRRKKRASFLLRAVLAKPAFKVIGVN